MAKISRRAAASSSSSSSSAASSSAIFSNSADSSAAPNAKPHENYTKSLDTAGPNAAPLLPDPLRGNNAAGSTAATGHNKYDPYEDSPIFMENGNGSGSIHLPLPSTTPSPLQNKTAYDEILAERLRIRAEFFATYDVMTGVRIAATLSGFFGLMVFLIVWKSRSGCNETLKVLKDPKMAAVAAVCMQEEEEREIHEAMVATGMSIYPDEYDAILYRRQRMESLGNVSAPPMLNRGFRFSSVGGGGYSSLLEPPRRFSLSAASGTGIPARSRRKSGSESSRILSNYNIGSSFGAEDFFMETEDELDNADFAQNGQRYEDSGAKHKRTDSTKSKQGFLEVPLTGQDSRRSSAMTCCSTESSYLERRCSAFTLGLPPPPSLQRKLSTTSRTSSTDNWDYYYPDIHIIQPTPKPSPCPSEKSIYDQLQASRKNAEATPCISKTAAKTTVAKGDHTDRPAIVPKHSIAYYDVESAQGGRKQQIHSISADTVDVYPYNQKQVQAGGSSLVTPQSASIHHGFTFADAPTEEHRPHVRRKIAVVELQRLPFNEAGTPPRNFENNNSYPYTSAASSAATLVGAANANTSSSISIDSTPVSIDKLNGSDSLGTVSVKALFNAEKRAPLASLSSFKISSLECQDSEMHSLDEDLVFLDSVADTDEDMRQLSSDSEEASLDDHDNTIGVVAAGDAPAVVTKQPLKNPLEKRFSLGSGVPTTARRPLLQRLRTSSASSSDRVSLLAQPLKELNPSGPQTLATKKTPDTPLETHFGTVISTNSPPTYPRRAQLLQQYSDPQSLPTTTEDTCSTLNTEVCAGHQQDRLGGGLSRTQNQHSSMNTTISIGRLSPSADNNHSPLQAKQLPRSRLADDPCASSISDSVINTRQPNICMPASLKNLILRGPSMGETKTTDCKVVTTSKSATNLSFLDADDESGGKSHHRCPSVMLELPLIRLPTEDSSESSSASGENGHGQSKSDESRDPSLPGSSRKWSKETLF